MTTPPERNFASKIENLLVMPPLKREAIRLVFCCVMALILNVFLFLGVEDDGSIKTWAEWPIGAFSSPRLLLFMIYFFLPFLAYTVLKALLLNANNAYSGILGFLANQLTGAMYCSGLILASITFKQYTIEGKLDHELIKLSLIVFASGLMYFYALQCAIQKSMSPVLLKRTERAKNI
ncbi:hypothetical protein PMI30_02035 [Pseudomonas sp. GM50]|uniref:hypothetical protein n=1 Tax=Pseudomonas sp. GM50 TaxID=1144332 RepID=UPI0002706061|nr:hypothetical protein [Pseudomonas sp. GM50]EJM67571.1 hypothetical protein PMI30_02035 [Pseudomonas sp. GM50]